MSEPNYTTFRAVEQGYHESRLIQPGATFLVDKDAFKDETGDEFKPNWAVEIEDGHKPTPDNVGTQEALNLIPQPVATIARPDQPLPEFHPTVAQTMSIEAAKAQNADGSEIAHTADILADQQGRQRRAKSTKKPGSESGTGTEPSPAQVADATDQSKAEVEAADAADKASEDDGTEFV